MPRRSSPRPRRSAPLSRKAALTLALLVGAVWVGQQSAGCASPDDASPDDGVSAAGTAVEPESSAAGTAARDPTGSAAGAAMGPAGQLRLVTWNIANMGRSKSDAEIAVMADVLAPAADVVAVQEVVTSAAGDDAVVRLRDALNGRGGTWDYTLSNETTGRGSERYAFLWRADRAAPHGTCWLDDGLEAAVDREPFLCRFALTGAARTEPVLVATFHAVPTSKRPAEENARLDRLHQAYPADDLVIAGDFNLPADRPAFDGLRTAGFRQALPDGARTTLKAAVSPSGEHLASAYDNVFYEPAELRPVAAGVLDFSPGLPTLRAARDVSDHLPVAVTFAWE